MEKERQREMLVRSVPGLIHKPNTRTKDVDAIKQLQERLGATEEEAILLLKEAMDRDHAFAHNIEVTYRALDTTPQVKELL